MAGDEVTRKGQEKRSKLMRICSGESSFLGSAKMATHTGAATAPPAENLLEVTADTENCNFAEENC